MAADDGKRGLVMLIATIAVVVAVVALALSSDWFELRPASGSAAAMAEASTDARGR